MEINCILCDVKGNLWQDIDKICVLKCGHIAHIQCVEKKHGCFTSLVTCNVLPTCMKKTKQVIRIDVPTVEKQMQKWRANEPAKCFLCYEYISAKDEVGVTKCGHIQHFQCLQALVGLKYIKRKAQPQNCPSCTELLSIATITKLLPVFSGGDDIQTPSTSSAGNFSESRNTPQTNNDNNNEASSPDSPSEASDVRPTADDARRGRAAHDLAAQQEAESEQSATELSESVNQNTNPVSCQNGIDSIEDVNTLRERCKFLEEKVSSLEQERNYCRNETKIWQMCYEYFEAQIRGTDLLKCYNQMPILSEENMKLKRHAQDLERQLQEARKDAESAESLRAEFDVYIEENLNLKNENEEIKKDLQSLRTNMTDLDSTSSELVESLTHENDVVNKTNETLMKEITALTQKNDALQRELMNRRRRLAPSPDQETPQKMQRPDV